jgi:hypothetical protein
MAALYRDGNLWIWFDNQWIGYLDSGFWNGGLVHTDQHQAFGEVYDPDPGTQMGNGIWGNDPSGNAAVINNPYRFTDPNTAWTESANRCGDGCWWLNINESPGRYNYGWMFDPGRSFKYGGPG